MQERIDIEKAKLDPSSIFSTPEDVLRATELGRKDKIEILKRWQYDASELEVAEEEGMGGGENVVSERIVKALLSLEPTEEECEISTPIKQGGTSKPKSS